MGIILTRAWIFFAFSGAKFQPYSQWNLGDLFSNFEKKLIARQSPVLLVFLISQNSIKKLYMHL